jgi:hypothetical protein
MKSTLLDLPSGGTIDFTNFVAIVPIEESDFPTGTLRERYQLLFAGLSQPLTLDSRNERLRQRADATAVKLFLSTQKSLTSSSEHCYEQIDLNKANAVSIMEARIIKHENITDEEDTQNAEAFERFKKRIDLDRPLGQKLYS